jgi:hypothetical protein
MAGTGNAQSQNLNLTEDEVNKFRSFVSQKSTQGRGVRTLDKIENFFNPKRDEKDLNLEYDIMRSENGFVEVLPVRMFILSVAMWVSLIVSVPILWYTQQRFYKRLPDADQSGDNEAWYNSSTALMSISMVFIVLLAFLYLRNFGRKGFVASRSNVAKLGAKINSKIYADASGKAYYTHASVGMQKLAAAATSATMEGLAGFHADEARRAQENAQRAREEGLIQGQEEGLQKYSSGASDDTTFQNNDFYSGSSPSSG